MMVQTKKPDFDGQYYGDVDDWSVCLRFLQVFLFIVEGESYAEEELDAKAQ